MLIPYGEMFITNQEDASQNPSEIPFLPPGGQKFKRQTISVRCGIKIRNSRHPHTLLVGATFYSLFGILLSITQ